ncbi:MAG: cold shock domain-containing protein [Actinomycetota bacterium]|nr:cold shock domain-containing protein [Actinomycetota bacterium]
MSERHAGTVAAFDEAVGLGEVLRTDGERFMFHCIELADGTRTIEVGVPVMFTLVRKFGRDEAFQVARA